MRRHELSNGVEAALWNFGYGCSCLGLLEEYEGHDEIV